MKYLFSAAGQKVLEDTFGVVPFGSVPERAERRVAPPRRCPGPNHRSRKQHAWSIDAAAALIAPNPPGTVFTLSNTAVPNMVESVTTGAEAYRPGERSSVAVDSGVRSPVGSRCG